MILKTDIFSHFYRQYLPFTASQKPHFSNKIKRLQNILFHINFSTTNQYHCCMQQVSTNT